MIVRKAFKWNMTIRKTYANRENADTPSAAKDYVRITESVNHHRPEFHNVCVCTSRLSRADWWGQPKTRVFTIKNVGYKWQVLFLWHINIVRSNADYLLLFIVKNSVNLIYWNAVNIWLKIWANKIKIKQTHKDTHTE